MEQCLKTKTHHLWFFERWFERIEINKKIWLDISQTNKVTYMLLYSKLIRSLKKIIIKICRNVM